jgi:hypothetical protein
MTIHHVRPNMLLTEAPVKGYFDFRDQTTGLVFLRLTREELAALVGAIPTLIRKEMDDEKTTD